MKIITKNCLNSCLKIDLDSTSVLDSIFYRFCTDFASILAPKTLPRRCADDPPIGVETKFEGSKPPTSTLSVANSFCKRFKRILYRFWNDFWQNFVSKLRFWLDFVSKRVALAQPTTNPTTNQPTN